MEELIYCIEYHDAGKVIPISKKNNKNDSYQPFDVTVIIPHSLFSLYW